jgi:hypothetical protein
LCAKPSYNHLRLLSFLLIARTVIREHFYSMKGISLKTLSWGVLRLVFVLMSVLTFSTTYAANITWIGGDGTWTEGVTAGWNPVDEPDSDDVAIFNTNNAVSLASTNTVIGLTLSGGIDFFTNDFDLTVDGLVQVSDANTNLIVGGANSQLEIDNLTINNGADVEIDGGVVRLDIQPNASLVDINAGGEILGHGTLRVADILGVVTTQIINDGTITAQRSPLVIFGAPQVGTLLLVASDDDARIDLDGAGETGSVIVRRNQTLDIDIPLADIFNGSIDMFHDATLDMSSAWIMGANATLDIDNGATGGIPAVAAGTSTIGGASFAQNGGTITVLDADGTLKFDAPFSMNGGTLTNNGHVIFNQNASIAAAANFEMVGAADLTVEANRIVNIGQTNFNLDGSNTTGTVITVNSNGTLIVGVNDYDSDSVSNAFDGTMTLNGGEIDVNTADAEFVMDGVLNMHSSAGSTANWSGEPLDIGNDVGSLDADLNITGANLANVQIGSQTDFNSDADVHIAAGGTLSFTTAATVNFQTVNAASNAEFTGEGTIQFNGTVNVLEAVTFNMVGGTVDLDGLDSVGEFINIDAPMTIKAATFSNFGRVNGGGGTNTLDINNSVGTGVLEVNLDDPNAEWTLNGPGVMNLVNDNAEATLLAGSDVNINGTVNVTGDVRTTARVDIAGLVNINTANEPLRLAGGNTTNDPNTLVGGTISGAGLLSTNANIELRGFGTINTGIDFDGNLFADNGTLTVNGAILDAARVGTRDADGILNVVNAWNTSVSTFVTLDGGELKGGTMTINNANGVSGIGLVSSRVINNTRLRASSGTLVAQTAANDNDWDGAGSGVLAAINAGTLELRDVGAAFGFTGTVEATTNSRVLANGFALDFNPGSNLNLTASTYESTSSTDIGGAVTIGAGGSSTIKVANNFFLTFETGSTTTLNGNVSLLNNNINIEQGAAFINGGGALVIPDGSHLVADNLADIDVLLDMQGAFRPGNFNGIGRVDLFDYQQSNTGELYVELTGTGLNAFDRLVASGDVVLDGYLNIDIDEISPGVPFVPVLGQTFNIITGNTVTGEFDYADVSGMPAGLAFHIEYLNNAVQLQVVNKPIFSADFDDDGDVDPTDLVIWQGAYKLNQLGDADGDNDSDGRDFLLWQQQYGSAPLMALSAATAVPEPGSLVLAMTIMGLFTVSRRYG